MASDNLHKVVSIYLIEFQYDSDQENIFSHLEVRTAENFRRLKVHIDDFQHGHKRINIEVELVLHTVFKWLMQ